MRPSPTVILLLTLVIFTGLSHFGDYLDKPHGQENALVVTKDTLDKTKAINFESKNFVIRSTKDGWKASSSKKIVLDQSLVLKFINSLSQMTIISKSSKIDFLKKDLKHLAPNISLIDSVGNKIASFTLGSRTAGRFGVYVYDHINDDIFIATGSLDILLNKTVSDFRQKKIYSSFKAKNLVYFEVKSPTWNHILRAKSKNSILMIESQADYFPTNKNLNSELNQIVGGLAVQGFSSAVESDFNYNSKSSGLRVRWQSYNSKISGFDIYLHDKGVVLKDFNSKELFFVNPLVVLKLSKGLEFYIEPSIVLKNLTSTKGDIPFKKLHDLKRLTVADYKVLIKKSQKEILEKKIDYYLSKNQVYLKSEWNNKSYYWETILDSKSNDSESHADLDGYDFIDRSFESIH